jgi:superfamily II DNA or RNA helicase
MIDALARQAGVTWFQWQLDAFDVAASQAAPERLCLYFKTGSGKTSTGLASLRLWGYSEAVVLCPPSTHQAWIDWGKRLGVTVSPMSHAKFRMKGTKISRKVPVIVDEFHMLGGHGGKGWAKMDSMAKHLQAPLIVMSATPNYNDADRVYCIQHVLDPHGTKGGFIEFLYKHCETEADPFSMTPKVVGFRNFANAAEYLAALPYVAYLPDDLEYTIEDVPIPYHLPDEFHRYGLNRRKGRIMASGMEKEHAKIDLSLISSRGMIRMDVMKVLSPLLRNKKKPVLVFSNHSTVADALGETLHYNGLTHALITGRTSTKMKQLIIDGFVADQYDVLVGTASLATGTDGLDKVCDTLVILDDTDDDSLRRQLIGRIMPRGTSTNVSSKRVVRLVLQ